MVKMPFLPVGRQVGPVADYGQADRTGLKAIGGKTGPFRAEEMHKTRLSKIEAIGEKIEKANRYLYEHKRAKIATQIRHTGWPFRCRGR